MRAPDFKQLQIDIAGREFDLAKKIFGLPDGNDQNDIEHRLSCLLCKTADSLYFCNPKFHCNHCNFNGELIQLIHKARNIPHIEAYDLIKEADAGYSSDDDADNDIDDTADDDDGDNEESSDQEEQAKSENAIDSHLTKESDYIIDPEFKSLLDTKTPEQYEALKESIRSEGQIRDALVVWEEKNTLADGHNRHQIYEELREELGKEFNIEPPKVIRMSFANRDDAMMWVLENQLDRRNLKTFRLIEVALKLKGFYAAKAKANQRAGVPVFRLLLLKTCEISRSNVLPQQEISGISIRSLRVTNEGMPFCISPSSTCLDQ